MQFSGEHGIRIRHDSDLFIDACGVKGKNIIVSHAHSDHAKITSANNYFMSRETASLLHLNEKEKVKEVPFGKKFEVNGFEVSMYNSGHILGAAQLKVCNGKEVVATTDFKLQKSILLEPAEILHGDVLLMESTFGLPEYIFPERQLVYEDMIKWVNSQLALKRFVVLGGYATGKAQELTKVVNEFLNETPLVHKRVFEQNKAYESNGVRLGSFIELNHNLDEADILILPPHFISDDLLHAVSLQSGRKVSCAIATGWRGSKFKTFPLSDHADFRQLLGYVKESEPKMVLTHHGFDRELAKSIQKKLGVPAKSLQDSNQKTLQEFLS